MAKIRSIESCSKELTARERVALKHPENTVAINEVLNRDGDLTFKPAWYAVVKIEDTEAAPDEETRHSYLVADEDGTIYGTGSESFWSAFMDIFTEMTGEDYEVRVYKARSKNGKDFITCSLV